MNIDARSSFYFNKESGQGQLLRMADVICWDEAQMAHHHCHEAVERMLERAMGNEVPWGQYHHHGERL